MIYKNLEDVDRGLLKGKVVFTNGCFDILHAGHVLNLQQAKALGSQLVVGLNSDSSVRELKGFDRPINVWANRATVLAALSSVDIVIGFEEATPIELIKAIRPDIITKGGDYELEEMIGKSYVEEYGGQVVILPYIDGHSTSMLIDKINK